MKLCLLLLFEFYTLILLRYKITKSKNDLQSTDSHVGTNFILFGYIENILIICRSSYINYKNWYYNVQNTIDRTNVRCA